MTRLRQYILPLLLAALLPLLPGKAAAVPVSFKTEVLLEWPLPDPRALRLTILPDTPPLARVRLFWIEITLLPSGRLVARSVVELPYRGFREPPPGPEPPVLSLPGALPLFLAALAALVVVGWRRRDGAALAVADGTT